MIDALRRDAWPRGVRRQRRELEAAREELRRELGAEPSLADLAARVGSDEARLGRTIVRINTIESTSPLSAGENVDGASLPPALVPSEPQAPDKAYEEREVKDRIRAAIASLPARERKVIGMYYYAEATMKQIGMEIGVNESRVSQLHARAVQRLRKALGAECSAADAAAGARRFSRSSQTMRRRHGESQLTARQPWCCHAGGPAGGKRRMQTATRGGSPSPARLRSLYRARPQRIFQPEGFASQCLFFEETLGVGAATSPVTGMTARHSGRDDSGCGRTHAADARYLPGRR